MNFNIYPYILLVEMIFLMLKLSGHVDWSWWLVWAPMWVPLVFVIVCVCTLLMLGVKIRFKKAKK